ncbi:hypothetical protein D3C71_1774120 [compost metagenome]
MLHQQDSHAQFPVKFADHVADIGGDGRLNTAGGFVEDQQLWFQYQCAANRQLLLFTVAQIAGPTSAHLPQVGKQVINQRRDAAGFIASGHQRHLQVFLNAEL